MGGRVGAVHGHKKILVIGSIIYILFNLICGFMRTVETIIVMRALSGVGAGIIVPNAIALLTTSFPPGMGRLIWVGLFGAMAPVGAGGGSVFPGFFGQLLPWWWLFFFLYVRDGDVERGRGLTIRARLTMGNHVVPLPEP